MSDAQANRTYRDTSAWRHRTRTDQPGETHTAGTWTLNIHLHGGTTIHTSSQVTCPEDANAATVAFVEAFHDGGLDMAGYDLDGAYFAIPSSSIHHITLTPPGPDRHDRRSPPFT